MSSAVKILPHYTYEEYRLWEGRWELIEGIPFAMSPAPSPRHQLISNKVKVELTNAIRKSDCKKCEVYDFLDIKISEDTVLQPDALVVCKEITKPFLDFAPALVVEVLSPSTAMKDRNNKFYIYQSYKIPYYLIIDADKNLLEVYHLKESGRYELETINPSSNYRFHLDGECSVEVILNNIWV